MKSLFHRRYALLAAGLVLFAVLALSWWGWQSLGGLRLLEAGLDFC